MAGQGPTQTQNQSQSGTTSSTTAPWGPAQGLLTTLLGGLDGVSPSPTAAQSAAAQGLVDASGSIPNFGPMANAAVSQFTSSNTLPEQGLLTTVMGNLSGALGKYNTASQPIQGMLSQYLDPNYLNPMTNPNIKGLIDTTNQDVTKQIQDQFSSAGRAFSPGNSQALARGLAQGQSGILANQYNQNVAAQQGAGSQLSGLLGNLFGGANTVFGAGNTTAQGLNTLEQTRLANLLSGVGLAGQVPGLYTAPGTAQLGAANTQYGLPISNIAQIAGVGTPIAGLGSTSSGTSTGTATGTGSVSQPFGVQQGLGAGIGLLGGLGSLGQGAAGLSSLATLSDERVKDDITPVGHLNDGQRVYSYSYKFDPLKRTHIGLLAQEVEDFAPEAVGNIGGIKTVNYDLATRHAAHSAMAA